MLHTATPASMYCLIFTVYKLAPSRCCLTLFATLVEFKPCSRKCFLSLLCGQVNQVVTGMPVASFSIKGLTSHVCCRENLSCMDGHGPTLAPVLIWSGNRQTTMPTGSFSSGLTYGTAYCPASAPFRKVFKASEEHCYGTGSADALNAGSLRASICQVPALHPLLQVCHTMANRKPSLASRAAGMPSTPVSCISKC